MIAVHNKKHSYIMLYVPKAACSVLRKTYVDIHKEDFTKDQIDLHGNGLFHRLSSLHSANTLTTDYINNLKKYVVVRNPYTRAISAFYDKFLSVRGKVSKKTNKLNNLFKLYNLTKDKELVKVHVDNPLHENELKFVDFIQAIIPSSVQSQYIHNDTFLEYLKFIKLCKDYNISSYDEHHSSQNSRVSANLKDVNLHSNTVIVHLENFEEGMIKAFQSVFPHPISNTALEHFKQNCSAKGIRNATAAKTYINVIDSYNLNQDRILQIYNDTKTLPCIQTMLCEETEQLIYDIYSEDFKTFNYQRNII